MKFPLVTRAAYERDLNRANEEVAAAHRSFNDQNEFHINLRQKLFWFTRESTYNIFQCSDSHLRGRVYALMQELGQIVGTHA